jgi:hypothetical protein
MTDLTPEKLRKRFHELTARMEKARSISGPIRTRRDALAAKHAAEVGKLNAKIREAEDGLYELEMERAMIARALKNVGEP